MPLCKFCLGITLHDMRSGYAHQPDWQALKTSARDCALCRLFEQEVHARLAYALRNSAIADLTEESIAKRGVLDDELPQGWDLGLETNISVHLTPKTTKDDSSLVILCGPEKSDEKRRAGRDYRSFIDWNESRKNQPLDWTFYTSARLDVYTHEDDPSSDYGVSVEGVVGQDPASEANFAMLTQWIEECVTTHPECGLGSPLLTTVQCFKRPLPRRLIDVSCSQTSRSVFVWETVGQLGSYVALSHCWGSSGSPRWTTTLKTIEDRKKSIELAILPKTYQDAVKITWKLGQRYLWVDSLCTIQDSAEDWQRESANMGHIYENSLVTICASGAENSHVGCLAPRKRGPFHPVILEQQLGKEKLGRIYIYRQVYTHQVGRDPTGLFYANVEQCPLASRAWTIQERMLSPRNVHYGKEQIFWECTRQRAGEGGARFVQVGNWTNGLQSMYQLSVAERVEQEILKSAKPSQGYLTSARWFIYWYQIIEFYTARKLSRPSDKLPALSGLALETQRRTGDQYLAGLRATCLHHGLAWRVETDSVSSRPQSYRAPSWSWAAIDGPASYNAAFKTTVAAEDILPAIDILGAHVETAGFDGFGEVAAGWIQLKGKLKPAHFKRSAPKTIYEPRDPETDSEEVLGDYYDDIKQLWDSEILYCLQLSIFPFTEGPSIPTPHTVLVLQPTFGVVGQYRRVGAGTIHKTDWFDECPRTTITII